MPSLSFRSHLVLTITILLLAAAWAAATTTRSGGRIGTVEMGLAAAAAVPCNGAVGQCLRVEEEEWEMSRRILDGSSGYISYGALQSDAVPCSRRGQSYYNCQAGGAANPYARGCSAITQCRS